MNARACTRAIGPLQNWYPLAILDRLLMRWLRRRGWVVFYLDPQSRHCSAVCWLKLYEQEIGRVLRSLGLSLSLAHL